VVPRSTNSGKILENPFKIERIQFFLKKALMIIPIVWT